MVKRVWIGHANSRDSGGVLIPLIRVHARVVTVYAYNSRQVRVQHDTVYRTDQIDLKHTRETSVAQVLQQRAQAESLFHLRHSQLPESV